MGSENGRPNGPVTSTAAPCGSAASQRVPAPTTSTTISSVSPCPPVGLTRCTQNERRARCNPSGPPTDTATNVPGRKRSGIPGAARVRWWNAPTFRLVSRVAETCNGPSGRWLSSGAVLTE